jgi:hypothetical protein
MGVFKSLFAGAGTTIRKPRVPLILYVVNLLFSVAVAVPFLAIVQAELGHSFLGSNVRPADLVWLAEAALKYGAALPALLAGFLVSAFLYLALQTFLNGGVVGRLLDVEGRTTLTEFFGDCGRYFWRFVRLFLVSLVFLLLTLGVFMRLVSALIRPLTEGAVTEWVPLVLSNLHLLVALLLLSIVRMVVDYSRIAVVADEERRALKALRHAVTFLRKRFFRAWAIYLLVVAATLAGTVAFYAVLGPLGTPGTAQVVAGFAWMQIYVLFRMGIRALFVSAQAAFYRSHPY